MKMYTTLMSAYGVGVGINFKFGGIVANTFDAHRVIQHYQEELGPEVADKIVNCESVVIGVRPVRLTSQALYSQYFENEKHPSSDETLLKATTDAGIPEADAKAFIEDKNDGMMDVKMAIREQAGNGVDAVPNVTIEGKRRDLNLIGAKEIEEYEKAFEQIVKESK